jgi:molecular chaperone GrpE
LTELREAYDRLFADFRNYKRHAEHDLAEAEASGRDELVRALIPVLSDLEAAARADGGDAEAVRRGVRMIRLKLDDILARAGYDRVDTTQGRMDPRIHEAIAVVPAPGAEDGRILEELSPGYTRNGQLVQPARVTVAKGRPDRSGAGHENRRDGKIAGAVFEADGG